MAGRGAFSNGLSLSNAAAGLRLTFKLLHVHTGSSEAPRARSLRRSQLSNMSGVILPSCESVDGVCLPSDATSESKPGVGGRSKCRSSWGVSLPSENAKEAAELLF